MTSSAIITSVCLLIISAILSWEIGELKETNKEQELKIQELSQRVETWEQLVGPRMQNLTALIEDVDDKMAVMIDNHNKDLENVK